MSESWLRRALAPVAELREGEAGTALLMFAYSFLAMTAYNIIKPITRSKYIDQLGADNIPWVLLAAAVLVGFIMQGYSRLAGLLPGRLVIPVTQGGLAGLLVLFWFLFGGSSEGWIPVAFYFLGLIMGILLISQFWTLANDIFDARQAKRLFGFIGAGSVLGGMMGSGLTTQARRLGTQNLLLVSAAVLVLCVVLVWTVLRQTKGTQLAGIAAAGKEDESVGGAEAVRLLKESRHLQVIALVIGFAALGSSIIEQQLNMAAAEFLGTDDPDALTAFLGSVIFYISVIGFVVQIALTSRIHRLLGIGFALLVLPVSLGTSALFMLVYHSIWAPAFGRVMDTSLRYTLDKTTREVLFLPLPTELKYRAKPFVDVTIDRLFGKGGSAVLLLILIKVLGFSWQQISYVSLALTGLWVFTAVRARREYVRSFRRSIEERVIEAEAVRPQQADLSTVEALVEELAHPDEERVLYAIGLLESLDKRNLVTPLLLHHPSEKVRVRALLALEAARPELRERWVPAVEALLRDGSVEVRAAAVHALSAIQGGRSAELMRAHLADRDPRVATIAALTLAGSPREDDVAGAEAALQRLAGDTRESAAEGRRQVAAALGRVRTARLRSLLVPLMFDPDLEVAREAVRSAAQPCEVEQLLIPPLVSLLRRRPLRATVREVLASRGEGVLDVLAWFLREPAEDIEVRRQIPATLARIPSPRSVELLLEALADPDEGLRDRSLSALLALRRGDEALVVTRGPVEERALAEARRYFRTLGLRANVLRADVRGSLLDRALAERLERGVDRTWQLLALLHPWRDVAVARRGLEGDSRARARAAEYLDNLLGGPLRRWVVPMVEDLPPEDKVKKGNALLRTRDRDLEDTLAQLIHDEDQLLSAAAIQRVEEKELWGLADDLEHVLSHRDARDLHAFEAASWALAARRISKEARRTRWQEAFPAAEVAHRLLQVPLLRCAPVESLFRIASAGRTVRPEGGRVLGQEGTPPAEVHFLLEGDAVTREDALPPRQRVAPFAVGLEEVLSGGRLRETVRSRDGAVYLVLAAPELLALVSEDSGLRRALLRGALAEAPAWLRVLRPALALPAAGEPTSRTLDQVRLLEGSPLFARATPDQLLHLEKVAGVATLAEGAAVFGDSEPAALVIVRDGEVSLEVGGEAVVARAGDTLGLLETLAGASVVPARVTV
ncbi:MAG TPA: Npt1/Npt2 family nucleotide transporter, partial [Vicinamibacteria bacterium]|nr:Npt1/Npt2 family nucleotide transporter [Vicinamibacteria bacterium]